MCVCVCVCVFRIRCTKVYDVITQVMVSNKCCMKYIPLYKTLHRYRHFTVPVNCGISSDEPASRSLSPLTNTAPT